jgi:hypothetical protein
MTYMLKALALVFNGILVMAGGAFGYYILNSQSVPASASTLDVEVIQLAEAKEIHTLIDSRIDREYFLIKPESDPELFCLAQNIFFEAGIDNKAGMAAVADVTLNRVDHTYYPNTICGVVKQAIMKESWKTKQHADLPDSERIYIPVRHKCQFSWFCDGKSDDIPTGSENWVKAQMIAWDVLMEGKMRGLTEGATHYHATYVSPSWSRQRNMDLVGRIGAHIFYRWTS